MPSENTAEPGQVLTNREACDIFKCSPVGRMRRSRRTNSMLLFYDPAEVDWIDGILEFRGSGREGDQKLTSHNRTLYQSDSSGVEVFLLRRAEAGGYTFEGKAELSGTPRVEKLPDVNNKPRDTWVFPLRLVEELQPVLPMTDIPELVKLEEAPKKRVVRAVIAVAVCALVILAAFWIASISGNSPEKTVNNFYHAVEQHDPALLARTLSNDPKYMTVVAEGLASGQEVEIRAFLKKGTGFQDIVNLSDFLKGLPEVASYRFARGKARLVAGQAMKQPPDEFRIRDRSPVDYDALKSALAARPEIAVDTRTGEQEICFPMRAVIDSFISRIIEGVRFGGVKYQSATLKDRATVSVARGEIYKVGKSGKQEPVTKTELGSLRLIPSEFLLERQGEDWRIISFRVAKQ